MKTIGRILWCAKRARCCPFNWQFLVEDANFGDYAREYCPFDAYEPLFKSRMCRWARAHAARSAR